MVFRVSGDEPLLFGLVDATRCDSVLLSPSVGAYASQFLDSDNRAHRGKEKIKARLIGDCDPDEWELPPKPKWMRWRTYNGYVERFDRYEAILEDGMVELMAKLLAK